MISVLHIGLPLEPPWLTVEEGEQIAARLSSIRERLEQAGCRYRILHASPDGELTEFRQQLRTEHTDAVLIGGGVAGEPRLAGFKQRIVDAARDEVPEVKVLDFDHSVEMPVLLKRVLAKL